MTLFSVPLCQRYLGVTLLIACFSSFASAQVTHPVKLAQTALSGAALADLSPTVTGGAGEKVLGFASFKSSDSRFAWGCVNWGRRCSI